ncbi:hypothetical protein ACP26L_13865 [Paenibacillus sp. S-38]|uniref:hypothetical protein n=1 Tax=Paenibacillus sp. S-38 TaxID=3416710 RepID=UPI003CEF7B34
MNIRAAVLRKLLAAGMTSFLLSLALTVFHGYAPYPVYLMYFLTGLLLLGVPCSLASDWIQSRGKGIFRSQAIGLGVHLLAAGILLLILMKVEQDPFLFLYADILVSSTFTAAACLWLMDLLLQAAARFLQTP